MFARGNWSIIGIDTATLPAFEANLADPSVMLTYSQFAAGAVVHVAEVDAVGINPFDRPRMDEEAKLTYTQQERLASFRATDAKARQDIAAEVLDTFQLEGAFAYGKGAFSISESHPLFGFWFVFNEFKDISDAASAKEAASYKATSKPYKFLTSGEKRDIESVAKAHAIAGRKQFPVLVDFIDGKVYAETTTKTMLSALRNLLANLGAETFDVAWKFGDSDWVPDFLAAIREQCLYKDAITKRAEDSKLAEPEALEDKELNGIVKGYFAMAELDTEGWVGLTTPANIRLFSGTGCVVAPAPQMATLLLATSEKSTVITAALDFQERVSKVSKKTGEEKTWRSTTFSIDFGYGLNDIEAGVALLKGFDLPGFKKSILREIRQSKQVPSIASFWREWLLAMSSATRSFTAAIRLTLDLDGAELAGVQRMSYADAGTSDVLSVLPADVIKMISDGTLTITVDNAL